MKGGAYCSRFFNVSEFENSAHWKGSNTDGPWAAVYTHSVKRGLRERDKK